MLLNFYQEVAQNWESWHVMHQRNVFHTFSLSWGHYLERDNASRDNQKIQTYLKVLLDYNQNMDDFEKYEQWYVSDIKNKTTDNARVLHDKREVVATKFKGLLAVIEPLKKELEQQLHKRNIRIPQRIV